MGIWVILSCFSIKFCENQCIIYSELIKLSNSNLLLKISPGMVQSLSPDTKIMWYFKCFIFSIKFFKPSQQT
jgi:hypothetical protein